MTTVNPKIRIEDLHKHFGSLEVLKGVSVTVNQGEMVCLIGSSGSGKTTLLRCLNLLEQPTSGKIWIGGTEITALGVPVTDVRRETGMVFQHFNLFPHMSVMMNIMLAPIKVRRVTPQEAEAAAMSLLAKVGLADKARAYPNQLSGGQKQRVAIARALANNPDILFCDEATSALDPQTTHSILNLIRDLQHRMNLTVVMITHQMEVVRDTCELVTVLDDGRPVEQGTVADIFTAPRSPVTRDFLAHLAPMEGPPAEELPVEGHPKDGAEKIVRWSSEGGHYILHFRGNKTGEPILSRLSRLFDIEFNIRAGGIQRTALQDVGTLITDITGDREEVEKALRWLKEQDIIVEEVNP